MDAPSSPLSGISDMSDKQKSEPALGQSNGTRPRTIRSSSSPSSDISDLSDGVGLRTPRESPNALPAEISDSRGTRDRSASNRLTPSDHHEQVDTENTITTTNAPTVDAKNSKSHRAAPLPKDRTSSDATLKHRYKDVIFQFLKDAGVDVDALGYTNMTRKQLGPLVRFHQGKYIAASTEKAVEGFFATTRTNDTQVHMSISGAKHHTSTQITQGEQGQESSSHSRLSDSSTRTKVVSATSVAPQVSVGSVQISREFKVRPVTLADRANTQTETSELTRKRPRDSDEEDSDEDAFEPIRERYVYNSTRKRLRFTVGEPPLTPNVQDDDSEDDDVQHDDGEDKTVKKARTALQEMRRSSITYMRLRKDEEDGEMDAPACFQFYRYSILTDKDGVPVLPLSIQQILDGVIRQRHFLELEVTSEKTRKVRSVGLRVALDEFKRECREIAKALARLIKAEDRKEQAENLVNDILIGDFIEGRI